MNTRNKKLSDYFPSIRLRTDLVNEISSDPALSITFNSWSTEHQNEFLDILTGNIGVKMLYDSYFKEILDPESSPERLSNLLSVLLGKKVKVKYALPNDSSRLGDEMSLVITDIVVELEDGSIANVEVQKIGYAFLGERAACYSADLLLRQYKRLRDEKKKHFSYKDIGQVYTIVFLESSPTIFKQYPDTYIHNFGYTSDSGIKLNMLQNYAFIPIDIFLEKLHNEGINSELDAWLTFLSCDEPEYIIRLIEEYPRFKEMYADLYEMCKNVAEVMSMFSKELKILDDNTVKYMIDELQEQLDDANRALSEKDAALADKDAALADKDAEIRRLKAILDTSQNQHSIR
ncbi:PD-(D/E)XK nuclease family transposase [Butyrivibrio sp. INlla16]|uniref:PD-(D/E)XK nuclease family transposase n=1 Tax=Butyrivibrio sp. INlla16 TaxID=1520807 RepID=UPI00088C0B5B|nr:PD-(D/E)XK nuclease family transposase [Butyrivibrio sp. INlla16]SDB07456.1 PD-(D/E)XK nuclease family transposase [Butyrivibrio sp. INlla16]